MGIHAFSPRRTVAVAAAGLAVLASLGAVAGSSNAAARAAGTAPACTTSALDVWLDTGGGGGTAGGTYYDLQFTNLSAHACTLYGYPGLSAVSLSGQQLGAAARRNAQHAPASVTLAAGTGQDLLSATATAVIKITDSGVYGPTTCGSVNAAGLRVYPPGQTASRVVPFPFAACSHSAANILTVEALEKGTLPQ